MSSSCMGKELPKEKKWGIRNCRERKCPELRKFLNEHSEQIVTGKDLPIVPHVVDQYKRFDDREGSVKLFIGTIPPEPPQWWTLSPSGKLRKVSKRTGQHCQGETFPDCKFSFEWHYDNKKED